MIHVSEKLGKIFSFSLHILPPLATKIAKSQTRFATQITLLNYKANIQPDSTHNSTRPKQVAKSLDKKSNNFQITTD